MTQAHITYGFADTPYGKILVGMSDTKKLCWLSFVTGAQDHALSIMKKRLQAQTYTQNDDRIKHWESAPLDVDGTAFQRAVWNALNNIPTGRTVTYSDIARQIGKPKAVRAVGSAIGANPVSLRIPCHRVIRRDGRLGGYAWGLERKEKILRAEQAA